jgi:hypothetical protein
VTSSQARILSCPPFFFCFYSHNVARQFDYWYPSFVTSKNLLMMARLSTLPFTMASAFLASYSGQTGYLLIVAFDVVLATVGTYHIRFGQIYTRIIQVGTLFSCLRHLLTSFFLFQTRSLSALWMLLRQEPESPCGIAGRPQRCFYTNSPGICSAKGWLFTLAV